MIGVQKIRRKRCRSISNVFQHEFAGRTIEKEKAYFERVGSLCAAKNNGSKEKV